MSANALRKNIERGIFQAYKEGKTYWIPVGFERFGFLRLGNHPGLHRRSEVCLAV